MSESELILCAICKLPIHQNESCTKDHLSRQIHDACIGRPEEK